MGLQANAAGNRGDHLLEQTVHAFFERYAQLSADALEGRADLDAISALYAENMFAATPAGVFPGQNDDTLRTALGNGFEQYRAIGTRALLIESIDVHRIDEFHCIAKVGWNGVYDRGNDPDIEIRFNVHYFLQMRGDHPVVFGWISGDEEAVLKDHGIIS